jgi:DNA polymerase-3 subunit delta'
VALHDVVGHERPIKIIRRAIETGRIHQAYLFTGMEGIGKKVVAMNMAKALNCQGQNGDACDHCAACQRIDKGVYPDCIVVKPDGTVIKIEQIRELQQEISLKPFEARWRVIVIDGAERLTMASANALLKTLEEPPPHTTLILIATSIEGLPRTVPSRCQRIRFTPLTDEEVKKVLANHLVQDHIDILVPLAAGSPGRAVQSDWQTVHEVKMTLGTAFASSLLERLQLAQDLAREEGKGKIFLEILEGWLRDIIVYQEMRDEERLLNRDMIDEIKRVAPHREKEELLQSFWSVRKIRQGVEAHGNLQLALESALVTMEGA